MKQGYRRGGSWLEYWKRITEQERDGTIHWFHSGKAHKGENQFDSTPSLVLTTYPLPSRPPFPHLLRAFSAGKLSTPHSHPSLPPPPPPSPSPPYLFGILVALPARFRIWPFSATSAPRLASLRNPRTKRELSFLQPTPVPSPIFYSVHFRPPAVWLLPPITIPHYFPLSRGLAPAFLVHFSLSFLHFLLTFLTTTTRANQLHEYT